MSERGTHTLAQCHACYSSSYHHQCNFPAKPIFIPNSVILNINKPEMMTEKAFIHATVEAMNDVCKENFGHGFIDSLVKCKSISKPKSKPKRKKRHDRC